MPARLVTTALAAAAFLVSATAQDPDRDLPGDPTDPTTFASAPIPDNVREALGGG